MSTVYTPLVVFALLLMVWSCQTTKDYPKGHRQPLGSHAEPGEVEERTTVPSPQEFWDNYVQVSKPVVFRGIGKSSPLFTKWTEEYLKETFGDMEVRVEGRKEKSGRIPEGEVGLGRDTLSNFIDTFHQPSCNKYVVSELPIPMYDDVYVPSFLSCGTFSRSLVEIDLWMSGGGTSSILHKDAFNAINCLYNGTKEWKLIEYKYEKKIYKAWEPENQVGGFSRINPEKVDLVKYPQVAEVPWSKVTVRAGDCLFLPKSMYHQVKSFGTNNLAIAILFSRFDNRANISFKGCDKASTKPLSSYDIDWQYPGHGEMTMGNSDLQQIKVELMTYARRNMTKRDVMGLLETDHGDYPGRGGTVEQFFAELGLKTNESISLSTIKKLPKSKVRKLALMFIPVEPSNTHNLEYNAINPNDILEEIANLLQHKSLQRDDFVHMYTSVLHGTKKFGNAFFDTLAGHGKSEASKKQVMVRIGKALQPYRAWQKKEPVAPDGEDDTGDAYENENEEERNERHSHNKLYLELVRKSRTLPEATQDIYRTNDPKDVLERSSKDEL